MPLWIASVPLVSDCLSSGVRCSPQSPCLLWFISLSPLSSASSSTVDCGISSRLRRRRWTRSRQTPTCRLVLRTPTSVLSRPIVRLPPARNDAGICIIIIIIIIPVLAIPRCRRRPSTDSHRTTSAETTDQVGSSSRRHQGRWRGTGRQESAASRCRPAKAFTMRMVLSNPTFNAPHCRWMLFSRNASFSESGPFLSPLGSRHLSYGLWL